MKKVIDIFTRRPVSLDPDPGPDQCCDNCRHLLVCDRGREDDQPHCCDEWQPMEPPPA